MDLAIQTINNSTRQGKDVVANYVVRQKDFDRFENEVETQPQIVITLAPRLEVAQSKRGDRELSEWEVSRINIITIGALRRPNSDTLSITRFTLDETVNSILRIIKNTNLDN